MTTVITVAVTEFLGTAHASQGTFPWGQLQVRVSPDLGGVCSNLEDQRSRTEVSCGAQAGLRKCGWTGLNAWGLAPQLSPGLDSWIIDLLQKGISYYSSETIFLISQSRSPSLP